MMLWVGCCAVVNVVKRSTSQLQLPSIFPSLDFTKMKLAVEVLLLPLCLFQSNVISVSAEALENPRIENNDGGLLSAFGPLPVALDPVVTYWDLWEHCDCDDYFESPDRPTDPEHIWKITQNAYQNVMMSMSSSSSYIDHWLSNEKSLQVPYSVRPAGENKGIGVFAAEFIPKGTVIFDYRHKGRAVFTNGDLFRHLIHSTSNMRDAVCHVLHCAGVQSFCNQNKAFITSYLDDGCFMNADLEPNVGPKDDCSVLEYEYALRDIEAGEELTCTYDSYHVDGAPTWDDYGL